jgi:hypothetical protein
MKTELKKYKVSEIVKGFLYNEIEGKGLYGLEDKLFLKTAGASLNIYWEAKKTRNCWRYASLMTP